MCDYHPWNAYESYPCSQCEHEAYLEAEQTRMEEEYYNEMEEKPTQ